MNIKRKISLTLFLIGYVIGAIALITYGKEAGWPDWALTILYGGAILTTIWVAATIRGKASPRNE